MEAILGAAIVLVVAGWYDTVLLHSVLVTGGNTFDVTQTAFALPAGYLIVAAGAFSVALLARWADSRLVDIGYVLVGAFFAFLFTLVWTVGVSKNGAPPVLPDPIASFLSQSFTATESGTLNTVALIGTAMLLVGIADLGLALRRQPTREARVADAPGSPPVAPQDAQA